MSTQLSNPAIISEYQEMESKEGRGHKVPCLLVFSIICQDMWREMARLLVNDRLLKERGKKRSWPVSALLYRTEDINKIYESG
jgi:hypothetical protein